MTTPDASDDMPPRGLLRGVRRPVPALLTYYVLLSIAAGPGIDIALPLRIFRFRTLQYEFDDQGVTMRWGILFRREISLTYARIQDIHLVSNVVERWLGLGRVQLQTASGQAAAEMTIEGLPDFERLRDELYQRMRGAKQPSSPAATPPVHAAVAQSTNDGLGDVTGALREAVDELRAIRALLSRRGP
jgi:membrane protein YdbS with pleckstrin-like domain